MRYALVLIAVLGTAACGVGARPAFTGAPPPRLAVAPSDTVPFVLRAPATIGPFALGSQRAYEDGVSGTQFRYVGSDSLIADVFVYPADPRLAGCGTVCGDSAVHAEVADFIGLIPELLRLGYFGSIAVGAETPFRPLPGAEWTAGRHLELAATRDGKPVRSDLYLYLFRGYRVKVRATYPDTPDARATVRGFTEELVRQLPTSRAAAP
ncbi:MAG TPA: hypothetical protein VHQ45_14115 [Gemmatimonadaceae bacterium]|nr:hypothetical protein [Gemmatimonadaceae bacterium]